MWDFGDLWPVVSLSSTKMSAEKPKEKGFHLAIYPHALSFSGSDSLVPDKVASLPPYSGPPQVTFVQQPMMQEVGVGNPPGDQLIMSIFTIFCCFMPLGIIALIKAMEVCVCSVRLGGRGGG